MQVEIKKYIYIWTSPELCLWKVLHKYSLIFFSFLALRFDLKNWHLSNFTLAQWEVTLLKNVTVLTPPWPPAPITLLKLCVGGHNDAILQKKILAEWEIDPDPSIVGAGREGQSRGESTYFSGGVDETPMALNNWANFQEKYLWTASEKHKVWLNQGILN